MSKKSCFKTFVLLFICLQFIISCSKYDDGPYFSLLTAKQRISRQWKVEYTINLATGTTHSADYDGWLLSFNKSGSFSQTVIYNQQQSVYQGKWEFLGKNQIKLEYPGSPQSMIEFYTIIRLTKKELWLRNDSEEFHYFSE